MEKSNSENSYSGILKRLSAFGGLQVFSIFLSAVRGKLVALLLGPQGMGIAALFNSSIQTVQSFAGLGLNLALVKDVAAAKEDSEAFPHILAVVFRLLLFTSLLGLAVTLLGSPLLSVISFGNYDYILSYIALASAVGLNISATGLLAVLQGLGSLRKLAQASLVGGLTGLFFAVPLYWFFGNRGIVPSIIIAALMQFLFAYISLKRQNPGLMQKVAFNWKRHKKIVTRLVKLGLILMAGFLVTTAVTYTINVFIRHFGTVTDVGLYQAASTLIFQSAGTLFNAISVEYFPRIAAAGASPEDTKKIVCRQLVIMMAVFTPVSLMLILFSPLVIRIMLTTDYLAIIPLMRWMSLAVIFQALNFPIGYLYVARDDNKAYIWMEIIFSNVVWITAAVAGYLLWGVNGLGVSIVVRGVVESVVNLLVCRRRYGLRLGSKIRNSIAFSLLICIAGFCLIIADTLFTTVAAAAIAVGSCVLSFCILRRRVKEN